MLGSGVLIPIRWCVGVLVTETVRGVHPGPGTQYVFLVP